MYPDLLYHKIRKLIQKGKKDTVQSALLFLQALQQDLIKSLPWAKGSFPLRMLFPFLALTPGRKNTTTGIHTLLRALKVLSHLIRRLQRDIFSRTVWCPADKHILLPKHILTWVRRGSEGNLRSGIRELVACQALS